MKNSNDAFPGNEYSTGSKGLSKREYAAIHILAGLLAGYTSRANLPNDETAAKIAVDYTDALFKKLES